MKLTKAQARAMAKLTDKWVCADKLQESLATLEALVSRRVAEKRAPGYDRRWMGMGIIYAPRYTIRFRLTPNAIMSGHEKT